MYELTKTLSLLIYPLTSGLVFLALALLALGWGRRRLGTGVLALAFIWLWGWSMPVTSDALRGSLESHYPYLPVEQVPVADAIVVLGGAFSVNAAWPYPSAGGSVDRYWHAARLYHAGRAERIILSGGRNPARPDNPTEAQSGRVFLQDMGVPDEAMLLDNLARTTAQHLDHIPQMLRANGLETFLLVTSATHMRRAEATFRAAGLDPIPVATGFSVGPDPVPSLRRFLPSVTALSGTTAAIHEVVGYWVYRWRGDI